MGCRFKRRKRYPTYLMVLIAKVVNHAINAINNVAVNAFCLVHILFT